MVLLFKEMLVFRVLHRERAGPDADEWLSVEPKIKRVGEGINSPS